MEIKTYEFRENDPSKRRDLFIYVKDRSGNLRSGRIVDVRR